jgi:hypothetical protein
MPARETGTWRDWLAPDAPDPSDDDLLTRDAFVTAVQARTPHIQPTTIASWERAGALPRPARRRLRGVLQATYPRWLVALAAAIPTLRAEGNSLAAIGERFRDVVATQTWVRVDACGGGAESPIYATAAPDAFTTALAAIARRYEARTGRAVERIELAVIDGNGDQDRFVYPA